MRQVWISASLVAVDEPWFEIRSTLESSSEPHCLLIIAFVPKQLHLYMFLKTYSGEIDVFIWGAPLPPVSHMSQLRQLKRSFIFFRKENITILAKKKE